MSIEYMDSSLKCVAKYKQTVMLWVQTANAFVSFKSYFIIKLNNFENLSMAIFDFTLRLLFIFLYWFLHSEFLIFAFICCPTLHVFHTNNKYFESKTKMHSLTHKHAHTHPHKDVTNTYTFTLNHCIDHSLQSVKNKNDKIFLFHQQLTNDIA